ncbi:hypothetical protein PRIPAC_82801 [Pristionchus pacificus]|uniref:Uncharacterized protein n=1 Tax=Pristionchus pacificus TaxID=54126 RepID=A0A2A6C2R4_PRIPA|nr:hypothetical protein PRIPAC_82801 [Pristionchus pacificus]|eukprot:PDM72522.1 hypothetical protein PRIPAC_38956 [Pristionchus pacificus]
MICTILLGFIFIVADAETEARKYCFIAALYSVTRLVISTTNAGLLVGCHVPCALDTTVDKARIFLYRLYTIQCEACSYNAATLKCTLLGAFAPTIGCSSTYTVYEKRTSGCTAKSSIPSNLSYTPSKCSRDSDVIGPPAGKRISPVCGTSSVGRRRIVYDVSLHDGTRWVLENYKSSFILWDEILRSYYYITGTQIYYFRTGTCVRVPSPPLDGCECPDLPSEAPLPGYVSTGVAARTETAPACDSYSTGAANSQVTGSANRAVYCAMGTWVNIIDSATTYNEYAVTAATCVAIN